MACVRVRTPERNNTYTHTHAHTHTHTSPKKISCICMCLYRHSQTYTLYHTHAHTDSITVCNMTTAVTRDDSNEILILRLQRLKRYPFTNRNTTSRYILPVLHPRSQCLYIPYKSCETGKVRAASPTAKIIWGRFTKYHGIPRLHQMLQTGGLSRASIPHEY